MHKHFRLFNLHFKICNHQFAIKNIRTQYVSTPKEYSASAQNIRRISVFIVLLFAVVAGFIGCSKQTSTPGEDSYRWQQSSTKSRDELLSYAIDSLDQMEKFQNQETFIRVFRQIYTWRQFTQNKNTASPSEPLVAAWPEIEMLQHIVDRLNQWIRSQPAPTDKWKPDPLIESLPESVREMPLVKRLGDMEFSAFDGFLLMETAYIRDVTLWARGDVLDDLSRAKNLFDWTVRNIQLERDSKDRTPLFPWENMLYGRGTPKERTRLFILLARQEGLNAALLGLANTTENTSNTAKIGPVKSWCVAILIDNKAYLFDPILGIPIPAKNGIKHDDQGRLDIQPATLEEVRKDESLLRQLDLDADNPYPFKAEELKNVVAQLETSPSSLSYRMNLVESHLAGKQKMVLTTSPTTQAERWKSLPDIQRSETLADAL